MKKEYKTGKCWSCNNKGKVIYTKIDDLGFLCIPCAVGHGILKSECVRCDDLYDCRHIASGMLFVCEKKI